MSVLINMEMPTNCAVCPFENYGDCYGGKVKAIMDIDDYVSAGKRHPRCPLVPVPPHGRLGDLDELERDFREDAKGPWNMRAMPMNWADAFEEVADIVADAPTIIEAEETNKEATNDQNNS